MTCAWLISFLDDVQVNDLRLVYSGFETIYQRHLEHKFESVRGSDFKFLKERILLARHLLGKNRDLDPEKRAELIQVLLFEGDLHEAQRMLPGSDKKKEAGLLTRVLRVLPSLPLFSGSSTEWEEEDALKREMRKITRGVTDSQFLLGLKSLEIEGLQPAIQEAETLAHTSLSSAIDAVVKQLTHAVLRMQQDSCIKEIEKAVQMEESRVLSDALVDFIRDINAKSAGRRDS